MEHSAPKLCYGAAFVVNNGEILLALWARSQVVLHSVGGKESLQSFAREKQMSSTVADTNVSGKCVLWIVDFLSYNYN